jgi:S-formylglutathione hydrolase FrmB
MYPSVAERRAADTRTLVPTPFTPGRSRNTVADVLDLPLDGPVPSVLAALGGVALVVALVVARRRWTALGIGVLVAVALGLLANPLVVHAAALFPEDLPPEVVAWGAAGIGGLALAITVAVRSGFGRALLALGCGLLVVVGASAQVNAYYAYFGTVGEVVGRGVQVASIEALPAAPAPTSPAAPSSAAPSPAAQSPAGPSPAGPSPAAPVPDDPARSAPETTPVVTRATGHTTGKGTPATARIPGTTSGFPARDGFVYLPPGYSPTGPRLPVMVMVAGQPGGPADWLAAGRLVSQLDRFAAAHGGLAPVTLVVDPTGSDFGNTACLDSPLGNAEAYLARDVPDWVRTRLRVDTNPAHWTFAGFSFGGTCALQLATRFPQVYGSFVDLQGEQEPSLGPDRARTVQTLFGGDTAAFDAVVPLTALATHRYPDSWGFFASGAEDGLFLGYMNTVSTAARQAGMTVRAVPVAGQGHSWAVAQTQLVPALEWLSPRLGFTA